MLSSTYYLTSESMLDDLAQQLYYSDRDREKTTPWQGLTNQERERYRGMAVGALEWKGRSNTGRFD